MDNYIQEAIKTESIDLFKVEHPRLLHACIGINTEVAEMLLAETEENFWEEAGDALWYCAVAADVFESTFEELITISTVTDFTKATDILRASSDALDYMKKVVFYGKELDPVFLARRVGTILAIIQYHAEEDWIGFDTLMEKNIRKLRARYGDKFTSEAAENRDLEAEREAMQ